MQVAQAHAAMTFWQAEVLTRQDTFNEVSALLTKAERTPLSGMVPLRAAKAYLQTGTDYYQAIRDNLTAKAQLEWAIGKDL